MQSFNEAETSLRKLAAALVESVPNGVAITEWRLRRQSDRDELDVEATITAVNSEYPFDRATFFYVRRTDKDAWLPISMQAFSDGI